MAKAKKVSGWKARPLVQAKEDFTNHNGQLFGRWETPSLYVVYSYGEHWPLFAWDNGAWYENEDKYSPTTSKHRTQAHPHCDTIPASRTYLKTIIRNRIADQKVDRALHEVQSTLGLAA